MSDYRYSPGKVDYNRSGRKNCLAEITWKLADGKFSMQAGIWNPRQTDLYCAGQYVEEVAAYFPQDPKAQKMLAIWRDWHLNDMQAGSPSQMAWLKEHALEYDTRHGTHYDWATTALAHAGINPDPAYLHGDKPYRYGSAWIKREMPPEVVAEIESWT